MFNLARAVPLLLLMVMLCFAHAIAQPPVIPCSVYVPAGTEFPLLFATKIDPKTARAGDPLQLLLADQYVVNGCVVAKKGQTIAAQIQTVVPPRSFGRHGRLRLHIAGIPAADGQFLLVDGPPPNSSALQVSPKSAASFGPQRQFSVPSPPLWLMIEGWHSVVPRGTLISVAISEGATIHGWREPRVNPAPGASASVTIFQSPHERAPGLDQLFSGKVSMGCFQRGAYFTTSLAPGNYKIGKSREPFIAEPGRSYFFRAYNNGSGALESASRGEFEFFQSELHPLPVKCQSKLQRGLFKPIRPKPDRR